MIHNPNRMRLHRIVETRDNIWGIVFDNMVYVLVLISLVTFTLKTIPGLSDQTQSLLYFVEIVTVILFTVEYGLRVYVAEKKSNYVFGFYGFVDLLAVLPFYLAVLGISNLDGRILRLVRLLRVFRLLKLLRFNLAIDRLQRAIVIAREEIVMFAVLSSILIYISAAGIWYFESEVQPNQFGSVFDGLWWAVVTLTTVGYGDIYPVTAGGRAFTFMLLMIGLGIVAIPPGIIASALSKARAEQDGEAKS